jgi:mono/diheme cytochrome c family protein
LACVVPTLASAQVQNPPYSPQAPGDEGPAHPVIQSHQQLISDFNEGRIHFYELRQMGLSVFSTPFNTHDGFGDGPFDPAETDTRAFGKRPTLQGNGLVLRVNGLDAQSCNECHTIVSNRSRPPALGIGGVGGMVQQAIIMPTMIDVADSSDDRTAYVAGHDPDLPLTFDGAADFSGRFANPPFLFGGGGVELLGKEMTVDLQDQLQVARTSPVGTVVDLDTHGVSFGHLVSQGGGQVDFSHVEGIGHDLVVRPFGRKGENFSMRDFDRGAMQFHFGIQPVEVVGPGVDDDGDGVVDEVTVGEMTALHFFDVLNPRPVKETIRSKPDKQDDAAGAALFDGVGCASCHRPLMVTRESEIPLAHPEVAEDPYANVYASVDLTRAGFDEASRDGGLEVPLFSDLKRHDMGPLLAETLEASVSPLEITNSEFITARLWGIADTAPYLHDGRASTLYQAIWYHGGEAQGARDDFLALSPDDQQVLLRFLGRLRTPTRPNEELLPLP